MRAFRKAWVLKGTNGISFCLCHGLAPLIRKNQRHPPLIVSPSVSRKQNHTQGNRKCRKQFVVSAEMFCKRSQPINTMFIFAFIILLLF